MSDNFFQIKKGLNLQPQTGTPSNPKSGDLFYNSASNTYQFYNGTSWQDVGSGSGSGGVNYILNPNAEISTSGWATYSDAAGSSPVDGTGGAANITFTQSSSNPLRGSNSFLLTKDAANRQGQGFSYDFTIDASDKGKVLQGSFEYQVASGTFVDNDLSVWIYDVTNATLIQPAPYLIKNSGLIEKFAVEFQTAVNSTSYRLIVHVASTSASAYTVRFDSFNLGPQAKLYGSPDTDWVSYTPTWSSQSTQPAIGNGTLTGLWRRVGDSMEIQISMVSGTTTTYGDTNYRFTLPSGYTIDTSKVTYPSAFRGAYGIARVQLAGGSTNAFNGVVSYSNTTTFLGMVTNADGTGGATIGNTAPCNWTAATANQSLVYTCKFPILGWSSSVVMSSDADTRVVSFSGYVSTNQALTANVTNINFTTNSDKLGAWTGSTYVVQSPGDYVISSVLALTSGSSNLQVFLNGVGYKALGPLNSATWTSGHLLIPNLKVGDILSLRIDQTLTIFGNSISSLSIFKLSGPSQIAASEIVSCSYSNTSGQSIANSLSPTTITNWTKRHDTHGMMNATTGIATIPVAGKYIISAFGQIPASAAAIRYASLIKGSDILVDRNDGAAGNLTFKCTKTFDCLAGDTVYFAIAQASGAAVNLNNGAETNCFTITKVG